jgi:DNA adenine methylase
VQGLSLGFLPIGAGPNLVYLFSPRCPIRLCGGEDVKAQEKHFSRRSPYRVERGAAIICSGNLQRIKSMRYLGGKVKIASKIVAEIHARLPPGRPFFDAFCGAGAIVSRVKSNKRHANDIAPIIHLLEAVSKGWEPPMAVTEEDYHRAKLLPVTDPLYSFAGYGCSFAGTLWGTYARDKQQKKTNFAAESARSLKNDAYRLQGIKFTNLSYLDLEIPDNALVYCDPPYCNTTGYGMEFDQDEFYAWVERQRCTILISEYEYNPLGLEVVLKMRYKRNMKGVGGKCPAVVDYLRIKPGRGEENQAIDRAAKIATQLELNI